MKDFINPLLLLVVIALLAWKVSMGIETPSQVEIWLLTLCVSGCIVNGLLSIAQALARRKAVMNVVWSVVFLIFGSCAWITLRQEKDYRDEIAAYQTLHARWKAENTNPIDLKDNEGRNLLDLSAILGRKMAFQSMQERPDVASAEEALLSAAIHAAEHGRHELLTLLAKRPGGFDFNRSINDSTPLLAAVLSDKSKCVSTLISLGANPNLCDNSGISPLMHAVINDNRTIARILISRGADASLRDNSGRDAASCSRSEGMDDILAAALK